MLKVSVFRQPSQSGVITLACTLADCRQQFWCQKVPRLTQLQHGYCGTDTSIGSSFPRARARLRRRPRRVAPRVVSRGRAACVCARRRARGGGAGVDRPGGDTPAVGRVYMSHDAQADTPVASIASNSDSGVEERHPPVDPLGALVATERTPPAQGTSVRSSADVPPQPQPATEQRVSSGFPEPKPELKTELEQCPPARRSRFSGFSVAAGVVKSAEVRVYISQDWSENTNDESFGAMLAQHADFEDNEVSGQSIVLRDWASDDPSVERRPLRAWGKWKAFEMRLIGEQLCFHHSTTGKLQHSVTVSDPKTCVQRHGAGIVVGENDRAYWICVAWEIYERAGHKQQSAPQRQVELLAPELQPEPEPELEHEPEPDSNQDPEPEPDPEPGPMEPEPELGPMEQASPEALDLESLCSHVAAQIATVTEPEQDSLWKPRFDSTNFFAQCVEADTVGIEHPIWDGDHKDAFMLREAWIDVLVPRLDAKYLGVRKAGLDHFQQSHPEISGHTVAETCGMVSEGKRVEVCPWTSRSMLPGVIVHETEPEGCCYIDLWRGMPNVNELLGLIDTFVSHAWHETVDSLIGACVAHIEECQEPSRGSVFQPEPALWIDIFCKNQWVVNSGDTEAELAGCVKRARGNYDMGPPSIVLVLSPFPHPTLFTRIWCLFELMIGTTVNARILVSMTKTDRATLAGLIATGELRSARASDPQERGYVGLGQGEIADTIDITKAEATVPADKEYIMGKINEIPEDQRRQFWTQARDSSILCANSSYGLSGTDRMNATARFWVEFSIFEWIGEKSAYAREQERREAEKMSILYRTELTL
eukprot:COSAG02_NODE_162_length_32474_cov_13.222511_12_plen_821_part_00